MLGRQLATSLQVVLAALSFAAGAALFRPWVPLAEGGRLDAKLAFFAEHKDAYRAVVIGSSRVFRGLDTRRVDALADDAGLRLRSFNLGAGGMRTFEQDYVLHRVLAMRPERLKWVFYEGGPVGMTLEHDHAFQDFPDLMSARSAQWHTPEETAKVLESILILPVGPREKLDLALTHVELMLRNLTSLGRGMSIVDALRARADHDTARKLEASLKAGGGFRGLQDAKGRERSREMERILRDPTEYDLSIARIPDENRMSVALDQVNLRVHLEQLRAAKEHGVELIYFTTPTRNGSPEELRLHQHGILPTLLHFNDPERYPDLFRTDHRYDSTHLNDRGVERFSRYFAEAFLAHLEARDVDE